MTEKLKCPCGKHHNGRPGGAISRISEDLLAQAQLYAQMPVLAVDPAFPFRPMAWQPVVYDNHDWGAAPTPFPTGYEPMRIAVPREMEQELRTRFRRQEARQAADRAMARAQRRG